MKIICLISFLLLFHFSNAQKVEQKISITSGYAIDGNSDWSLKFASKQAFTPFFEKDKIDIGYTKYAAVWCYFKFKNNHSETIHTWLSFDNNHIDSLSFYEGQNVKIIGDRTVNQSPFIASLAFELQFKPYEEKVVFVRLKKQTSFLDFSYKLEDATALENRSSKKIALVAFFVGIAFLLLMINSILFLMTKNSLYIYYISYSLLTVLYATITTNFAKHIVLPEFLFFSEGRIFTGALWYIALSLFLNNFLRLKKNQPFKYTIIKFLCLVNFILILLGISLLVFYPDFDFRIFFTFGYIVFMVAILILFFAAITHLKIERQQAVYALLAFAPQLIWGACLILKTFNFIPKSLGDSWVLYACLYEVFLFGYVLSRNYIDVFLKNNELMQEVIFQKESSINAIKEVQLRERRSIANIIHDNIGSKIAHIIHLFDMKSNKLAKQTMVDLANDIRDISHKILPKSLDDGALISSLRSQITILNAGLVKTEIELFDFDFPERINETWIYDVYLISLELINNAIKHGKASLITIEFYKYSNNYHFQFTDDGKGFDTSKTPTGFGLENIEKRIKYYQGSFELNSAEGQGTVVQINIPI